MIELIIFDLEGIVINTESLWDESQKLFLKKYNIEYELNDFKPLVTGRTISEGTKMIKKYYNLSQNENILTKERLDIIYELLDTKVYYIDGFISFYKLISNIGIKTCAATSMDKGLFDKIRFSKELTDLFNNNIFFSSELKIPSKPHPDIYLYSANKMSVSPKQAIVIEDSPVGITAAKDANMICIGLTTTFNSEYLIEADFIINSYSEIPINELNLSYRVPKM